MNQFTKKNIKYRRVCGMYYIKFTGSTLQQVRLFVNTIGSKRIKSVGITSTWINVWLQVISEK